MPRFFLELSYQGTHYSGFQSQKNANTIQAEVEKAIGILLKEEIVLTGSSRTDAGVHALQNFFHFDSRLPLRSWKGIEKEGNFLYKMNAILPEDIAVRRLLPVPDDSHCRFGAVSREYRYYIYRRKNPFLRDRAFYFPYRLNLDKMQEAAAIIREYHDFTAFSKKKTQVKSFLCDVTESKWIMKESCLIYHVSANRFLRGMVRALVATMLKLGREKISLEEFRQVIESKDSSKASFAAPPQGLFLLSVKYPDNYFKKGE